jgi:hypothetical protein
MADYKYLDIHPFYLKQEEKGRKLVLTYLKKLESKVDIIVNKDGSISVNGTVNFYEVMHGIPYFPVKFKEINGDFLADRNALKSLVFSPEKVTGKYNISSNRITSLEGAPQEVGTFVCNFNKLTSLEGLPIVTTGEVSINKNSDLKSLKGLPDGISHLSCVRCDLESLEGSPQKLQYFDCSSNYRLKSLIGGPVECDTFICKNTAIEDLKGAPTVVKKIDFSDNEKMIALNGLPLGDNVEYVYEGIPNISKKTFDQYYDLLAAKKKHNVEDLDKELGFDIDAF